MKRNNIKPLYYAELANDNNNEYYNKYITMKKLLERENKDIEQILFLLDKIQTKREQLKDRFY